MGIELRPLQPRYPVPRLALPPGLGLSRALMDDNRSRLPVLAACLATILGGSAVAATRFAVGGVDPATLAFMRHLGAGVIMMVIAAVVMRRRPWAAIAPGDWGPILALAGVQYAAFGWLFASGLSYVPAARGALVIATYPVQTLILAALLRRERLTGPKIAGALCALAGVAVALGDRTAADGPDVWKGDLLMFGAAFLGSVYNVLSGPYLRRSSALAVTGVQLFFGALLLLAVILASGGAIDVSRLGVAGWSAVAWLVTVGGAVCFYLWIWALEKIAPSRVAITVTLNPIAAAAFAALVLAEPITWQLAAGLVGVVAGIALANRAVPAAVPTLTAR